MKITITLDLQDTIWDADIQLEDTLGNKDGSGMEFPAPTENVPLPFAFSGMFRTLDGVIQSRIWPEELEKAAAELGKPDLILPGDERFVSC